jgi:hypothetical protein
MFGNKRRERERELERDNLELELDADALRRQLEVADIQVNRRDNDISALKRSLREERQKSLGVGIKLRELLKDTQL